MDTILNEKEVCAKLKMGRTRLYEQIKAREFPAPYKDGRNNRWRESDIEQYMKQKFPPRTFTFLVKP